MSSRSDFVPNAFSSTPVRKSSIRLKRFYKPVPLDLDVGVLSDDEDTFSLLSPIYHDSFDSEENLSQSSGHSSPTQGRNTPILSEICELPKTHSEQIPRTAAMAPTTPHLGAWEQWLLNKAKLDQLKSEKKAEEERLFQEKKVLMEKEHEQKLVIINQRIHEWLNMKQEQEKQAKLLKKSKEQEALNAQMEKQRETELKAQEKYKLWLQKKNHEKAEKEKKQKEEAALKEEQERERRRMSEEKFKEWLYQANTKNTVNTKSTHPSPHGIAYPTPGFYNPIPWKPIHIPPSKTVTKVTDKKTKRRQRSLSAFSRQQNVTPSQSRR